MQNELSELMIGMHIANLTEEIVKQWKARTIEIMISSGLYKKTDLIEQAVAIGEEAAKSELRAHMEFHEKLRALVELNERREAAENADRAVN